MTTLAIVVTLGFMSLKYPTWQSGAIIVGGTAYLLGLIFWFVVEFDDPCHGLWYIKSIDPEWLEEDPKKWRAAYRKWRREKEAAERIVVVAEETSEVA